MTDGRSGVRRLGYAAVALAYLQIVFGAIVRITGSGMGCGDHWPKCAGRFFPPLDRPDLVIELTHRYLALTLSLVVIALLAAASRGRRGGERSLVRPASLSLVLVVAAALLGAITVKTTLATPVVVAHSVLALALLASLAWFTTLAGGFGAQSVAREMSVTAGTRRSAVALAVLTLTVIVFGAFTANVTGAAGSCIGFPHCREVAIAGHQLGLNIVHRVLAFALLGHAVGLVITMRRRSESRTLRLMGAATLGLIVVQLMVAAAMVEMRFPTAVRSLHQALGAAIWLAAFVVAALTRLPMGRETHRA